MLKLIMVGGVTSGLLYLMMNALAFASALPR